MCFLKEGGTPGYPWKSRKATEAGEYPYRRLTPAVFKLAHLSTTALRDHGLASRCLTAFTTAVSWGETHFLGMLTANCA